MERLIDSDMEIFSERYSLLSAQSNRIWAASAILLLAVIAADFSEDGSSQVFGISARSDLFYWGTSAIALFINFAYCSSHIVNLEAGKLYWGLVRQKKLEEREVCCLPSGRRFTAENLAHFLYQSNYNRTYPIERAIGFKSIAPIFKKIVDFVYSSLPISTCLISIWNAQILSASPIYALPMIGGIVVFAVLPWVALMIVILGWSEVRA